MLHVQCYVVKHNLLLSMINIITGDSTDSLFMVTSAGVVSAVGVLDREAIDFFMINVAVSPHLLLKKYIILCTCVTYLAYM